MGPCFRTDDRELPIQYPGLRVAEPLHEAVAHQRRVARRLRGGEQIDGAARLEP